MAILDRRPVRGARSSALAQVRAALPDLRPAEHRVAERLLADPGQAIALSIGEFAMECCVAQPTVSRFCRSVGFPSYAALRLGLANDFAAAPSWDGPRAAGATGLTGPTVPSFATLVETLAAAADLPLAAGALRAASRVEVWPAADLLHAGALLADRLAALAVPAACATAPGRWPTRAAELPPGAVVVALASTTDDMVWAAGLVAARDAGARILCCTARPASPLARQGDWLVPLPADPSLDLAGLALVDALAGAVRDASDIAGPPGPASPWRPWPHARPVFLPTGGDPIPAILLARDDPPRRRPLVLYFSGIGCAKEAALPGSGSDNHVCPRIIASLLNADYHVLVVDAQAHGARKRAWEDAATLLRASFAGEGPDLLAAARAEAPRLVDGALALDVADAAGDAPRLAVAGQSWGGLQALLTLAGDPRVACGVGIMPIIHIPQLRGFADQERSPRVVAGGPGAWMGPLVAPRPLLVIAGDTDEWADPRHARTFVEAVRPAYAAAGAGARVACTVLPHLAHRFDARQVDATVAWLDRYLPPPVPVVQPGDGRAAGA